MIEVTEREVRRSTLFITSLPEIIRGVVSIRERLWDMERGSSGSMERRGGRFLGEVDILGGTGGGFGGVARREI